MKESKIYENHSKNDLLRLNNPSLINSGKLFSIEVKRLGFGLV